jgi:hypothetical protein
MNATSPLDAAIAEAQDWGKQTVQIMQMKTHTDTGRLFNSLKAIVKKDKFNVLRAITFKMVRYGVYHELGAGRDYRGAKGSNWKYEKPTTVNRPISNYKGQKVTDSRRTSQTARNNMGSGKRPAVSFFDDTLRDQVPKLADALADITGDMIVRAIGISERDIR